MTKSVLIVEDNELNMKLFHDLVKSLGLTVYQSRNGMEAFSLVKEHLPTLVIMDIQLPEVSGIEVAGWIKAEPTTAHIPVLAVTAFAMKGDEDRIRASGCDGYLSKPIAVGDFLQTVKRFVGI